MPSKITETSFESKLGILPEKPGWALQRIGVEADPKPSKIRGSHQKLPSPSKSKVPAHGGTRDGHWLQPALSQPGLHCLLPWADTPLYLYLNQVALSDTFIIVFNSPKSVFAWEERMRI